MPKKKDKLPEYLLLQLSDLFVRVGFRSPSMKDVSEFLGISKKTLYQYVGNKEELLIEVIRYRLDDYKNRIERITANTESVIEEFGQLTFLTSDLLQDFHYKARKDLQKFYPGALAVYQQFVHKELQKAMMSNLMKGVNQSVYRNDILKKLTAQYLIKTIELLENDEVMIQTRMTNKDLYERFIQYHLLALTSEKGRKMVFEHFD